MSITATELKKNLGKYLALSSEEDIYITRNGTVVAKLSNPFQDRVDMAKSLFVNQQGLYPRKASVFKGFEGCPSALFP